MIEYRIPLQEDCALDSLDDHLKIKGEHSPLRGKLSFSTNNKNILITGGRIRDEECIMSISGRMLLGLEEGVKVPEAALNKVVGRHLRESHLKEDLSVFCSYLGITSVSNEAQKNCGWTKLVIEKIFSCVKKQRRD